MCISDSLNTLRAMEQLGAKVDVLEERQGYGPVRFRITGVAMSCLLYTSSFGSNRNGFLQFRVTVTVSPMPIFLRFLSSFFCSSVAFLSRAILAEQFSVSETSSMISENSSSSA